MDQPEYLNITNVHQNEMDCIIQQSRELGGVYLGSVEAAHNKSMLFNKGVKSVLTLCSEREITFYHNERINHKVIPIIDSISQDLQSFFKECHDFINQGRSFGNVLVHCIVGVSRSATVVLSYLMTVWNQILEESLIHIILLRPTINPNMGFITQLLEYERFLYGRIYSTLTPELTYHFVVQNDQNYAPQQNLSYQIIRTPEKSNNTSQISSNYGSPKTILSDIKISDYTERLQTESLYYSVRTKFDKSQQLNKIFKSGWPVTIPFGLKRD